MENERRSNDLEEQNAWSVFLTELENAKKKLEPIVEIPHAMIMVKEVLRNPDRYMGVINKFWDLYERYQAVTIPDAN